MVSLARPGQAAAGLMVSDSRCTVWSTLDSMVHIVGRIWTEKGLSQLLYDRQRVLQYFWIDSYLLQVLAGSGSAFPFCETVSRSRDLMALKLLVRKKNAGFFLSVFCVLLCIPAKTTLMLAVNVSRMLD